MPDFAYDAKSFGIALAASVALTFAVRSVARRLGLIAKPRADRWHKRPTALYGGVGIFLAFVAVAFLRHREHVAGEHLLMACCAGMFVVGLIDDAIHLKPYAKLVGQIFFCTAITMYGLRLHWLPSRVLDQGLTIFWLVGITNAINLLDNLDGLAGGIAAIAALFLVYFCEAAGFPNAALLSAIFAGAVVGFLVFNFNPASIFMGDCGSLFIGFFLGAVTLISSNSGGIRRNVVAVLSVPVLLLLIPIIDTTLVTITRRMAGRPVSQGGRDHTSHRLVTLGLSERNAALTLWTVAALSGAVAVFVRNASWTISALLVPAFFMASLFLAVFVGGVRVYETIEDDREVHDRALLPTLADFGYKRRIFEVLCDVAIIVLAYYAAFLLRFDGNLTSPYYQLFLDSLPLVIVLQLGIFLALGLYDGLWRYTSMSDLSRQLRAVGGAWIASTLAIVFVFRLENISRSVLIMDGLILTAGVTGTRIFFRLLRTWAARFQSSPSGRRVLIYGAGDGGELLLRELLQNHTLGLHAVGFVDDDPQKQGRMIHGVRVLGPLDRLSELANREQIDEVVVSTAKLAAERHETLALLCSKAGLRYRRMRISLE